MNRRAFTLIEMMIVVVILVVIMGAVIMFTLRGQEMVRQETIIAALDNRAMQAAEKIADDLRRGGASQLIPPDPTGYETEIRILPVIELDPGTGEPIFGAAPTIYRLERAPNETWMPGYDQNGNGLNNDFVLRRITPELAAAGDSGTVIATGVKGWDYDLGWTTQGLRLRRVPGTNRVRISVTLQQADHYGRIWERRYITSVTVRND
jgi:prepilin-type N-terminal cleavage/methylation domain-containing protein